MIHRILLSRLCLSRCRHLLSAALDNELNPIDRVAVENHLKHCTRCEEEMEELRFARNAMRNLEVPIPHSGYPGIENLKKRSGDQLGLSHLHDAAIFELQPHQHRASAFVIPIVAAVSILIVAGIIWLVYSTKTGNEKSSVATTGFQAPAVNSNSDSGVGTPSISQNGNNGSLSGKGNLPLVSRRKVRSGYRETMEVPQHIELPDQTVDAELRGSEVQNASSIKQYTIVRFAFRETLLTIDLPENSKKGRYVVELQRTDRFKGAAPLSESKSDGQTIFVKLRLQRVRPGNYILFVERKDSSGDEYIGRYPVAIADPDPQNQDETKRGDDDKVKR